MGESVKVPKSTARERVNEPWANLSTLPLTSWKAISGTFMCWMVAIFMMGLIWGMRDTQHLQMIPGLVDSLLMFVGVVAGVIPATMFATKRLTFKEGGPEARRSDVATSAAAKAEGVAVAPATTALSQRGSVAGTPAIPDPDIDGGRKA